MTQGSGNFIRLAQLDINIQQNVAWACMLVISLIVSGCAPVHQKFITHPLEPRSPSPTQKLPVRVPSIATKTQISNPPSDPNVPVTGTIDRINLLYLPLVTYTATPDWNQLSGNQQHTGYSVETINPLWRMKWIWNGPAGGGDGGPAADHLLLPQDIQPVTGDGNLYIGHSDGMVRAISEATGQIVWVSQNLGAPIVNTGAFDPDTKSVYFAAKNGKFYQLESTTGAQKRVIDARGTISMAPLLAGNTVYIGSYDGVPGSKSGTLFALDKTTLEYRWSSEAGAWLVATPAYSNNHGGMVILLAEDKSVHAVRADGGTRLWRVVVNGDPDPKRGTVFADTYPVVSEVNDVVIVRSYLDWYKMWDPSGGAPSTPEETRTWLKQNPSHQSLFVLRLADGVQAYVAPVLVGGVSNSGDFMAPSPQAVVKSMPDGSELAYLFWRSKQSCPSSYCDGRNDTLLGEMDLKTGNIRFVQTPKDGGGWRVPSDEQSALSMAGDTIFHAHWMLMESVRITDRSSSWGGSYAAGIRTAKGVPITNTLSAGTCPGRSNHTCTSGQQAPCDGFLVDPGFYVYYSNQCAWWQYWTTPVRNVVIHNNTIYYRSVDGAITAVGP